MYYYEEITLYGLITCNIKDFDTSIKYLNIYKNKINNWASCDLFCSSYKIVNKHKDCYWKYINDNINSDNLFSISDNWGYYSINSFNYFIFI